MASSEYGLLMPLVACDDMGGPFHNKSFVAGMRTQQIWDALKGSPAEFRIYVEPALKAQLDLVAMHYGYTMATEDWDEHPDEWTMACFTPAPGVVR